MLLSQVTLEVGNILVCTHKYTRNSLCPWARPLLRVLFDATFSARVDTRTHAYSVYMRTHVYTRAIACVRGRVACKTCLVANVLLMCCLVCCLVCCLMRCLMCCLQVLFFVVCKSSLQSHPTNSKVWHAKQTGPRTQNARVRVGE